MLTCYNEECPSYGEQFMATEHGSTMTDAGYLEGECPGCGELINEGEVDRLTPDDLAAMEFDRREDELRG